jgi:hypothetical protein
MSSKQPVVPRGDIMALKNLTRLEKAALKNYWNTSLANWLSTATVDRRHQIAEEAGLHERTLRRTDGTWPSISTCLLVASTRPSRSWPRELAGRLGAIRREITMARARILEQQAAARQRRPEVAKQDPVPDGPDHPCSVCDQRRWQDAGTSGNKQVWRCGKCGALAVKKRHTVTVQVDPLTF